MHTVIPVASGKGGVGKSLFSANLGVALAQAGKTVLLVDLDLGGSNLHTCLGIRNNNLGIGHYVHKKVDTLEELIIATEQHKLFLIPGDSLLPATANMGFFRKVKLLRELRTMVADYVILDLGGGTSHNTVDFFLAATGGVLVCTPETTSILNAYSFLKSVCYRMLYRSFAPKSEARRTIHEFMTEQIESSDRSLAHLTARLAELDKDSGARASEALSALVPRVVLNMGRSTRDVGIGGKLRTIARKNLNVEVEYIGFLPYDETLGRSVIERRPALLGHPHIEYATRMNGIAARLIDRPVPTEPHLYEDDADLANLSADLPD
ncbi:MAG: P-loop NTPase [Spirochaetia bacterium]